MRSEREIKFGTKQYIRSKKKLLEDFCVDDKVIANIHWDMFTSDGDCQRHCMTLIEHRLSDNYRPN